jgi:oligosaccharide reducing-end xylanase
MFMEAGYSQPAIDAKIEAAVNQLYYAGSELDQRIYYEVPSEGTAYITDVKNGDVRTEGMGYGMMNMLQLDNQTAFDMLWGWVKLHMYHGDTSDPLYGWSAWHAKTDGTRISQGPAPDGETWFITSLYFAARRWGDGSGKFGFNYSECADAILTAVTSKPEPRNMFTPAPRTIVRFDPGTRYTDPSYFLPAFYATWALRTSHTPARWREAAASTREVLLASANKTTGLAPHSCGYAGAAVACAGPHSCDYEDDAWRVARNWALDYHWTAADPRQVALSNAILGFFAGAGRCDRRGCRDQFYTDGTPIPGDGKGGTRGYSPGVASMNAVAALASNESVAWEHVDRLWDLEIPAGDDPDSDRYYSGSLYIEALLHLSGRYRAWL